MKKNQKLSLLFAVIGLCLLAVATLFCLAFLSAPPIMVRVPDAALECSETLMEALQKGDYDTASACLTGQPALGLDREPTEEAGKILWEAFSESFQYEFTGDCYATPTGVARSVMITTLDLNRVSTHLPQRIDELLEEKIATSSTMSEIYDANGDFRQDLVQQLLLQGLSEILEEDAATITRGVSLNLVYENNRWWVTFDQKLLQAISGGVAG